MRDPRTGAVARWSGRELLVGQQCSPVYVGALWEPCVRRDEWTFDARAQCEIPPCLRWYEHTEIKRCSEPVVEYCNRTALFALAPKGAAKGAAQRIVEALGHQADMDDALTHGPVRREFDREEL